MAESFTPLGAAPAVGPPLAQSQLAVTTSVQQINLPIPTSYGEQTLRIVVDGTANIAWCVGVNSQLTINNGVPMLGNTIETFDVPIGITQLSVIGTATGSTIRVTVGDGP